MLYCLFDSTLVLICVCCTLSHYLLYSTQYSLLVAGCIVHFLCVLYSIKLSIRKERNKGSFIYYVIALGGRGGLQKYDNCY